MFVSHAQNFEDVLLRRALREVSVGAYLDIGAHDPEVDSVSLAFYTAGWRGIHVEPIPAYAARLRECRPDEQVVEAAVTDTPGPITFYELSGLSTGRPDIALHHAEQGHHAREILVPTVRLAELLDLGPDDLHWLKIDVEGMEADVLRSWGASPARPWVLVIESTYPNSQEHQQHLWIGEVLDRGYEEVFFDGLSRYFVHAGRGELKQAFATPANVFDNFTVPATHFAARRLREEADAANELLRLEHSRSAELNSRIDDLEEATAARGKQLTAAEARLMASAMRIEELELAAARDAEQLKAADRLRVQAQRTDARLAAARALVARLQERSTSLEDRLAASLQSIDVLNEELAAAHREVARLEERTSQLQSQHAAQLNSARGLIKAAREARPGAWQRVGLALGLARRSTALDALSGWASMIDAASAHVTENMNIAGASAPWSQSMPDQPNPYLRADSLSALLEWDDLNFVRCAYVTVLGRQPDAAGERHYVRHLRRGVPKMQILRQLRNSPEAIRHDPGIAGFDRALRRARLARTPVVGALFRSVWHMEGDSSVDRALRVVSNDLARMREVQFAHASKLDALASSITRVQTALEQWQPQGRAPPIPREPSLTDPIRVTSDEGGEILRQVGAAVNASAEAAKIRRLSSSGGSK